MDVPIRSFDLAGDVIDRGGVRSQLVTLGSFAVARNVHQPGWRWRDFAPSGEDTCPIRHVGYCIGGRLAVALPTGLEFEVGPRVVFDIPPGHDAWVLGEEPFESVEWMGARSWMRGSGMFAGQVLATLVLTDIVDSTSRAAALGSAAWADLIAAYEHGARDTLEATGGTEVKLTGDGILALYDSAARALRGAVALRAVADALGLGTRSAVHAGEVEVAEGDVHGLAVHECARVAALGEAGEIVVTAAVTALVADAGFAFEDRGEHTLRGIAGPRRLFVMGPD